MKGKLLVGSSPLHKIVEIMPEIRGTRILDVGCGAGVYGYILRNKWQDTYPGAHQYVDFKNRDVSNDEPSLLIGCDIQIENLRRCRYHNIYDYLCAASADRLPFAENTVDTILCIEVLEHLTKDDALRAIESFKRIAARRIIITVPRQALDEQTHEDERSFIKIDTDDEEMKAWIEAERHKSAFSISDLKRIGFQVGETIENPGLKGQLKRLRRLYRNHYGRNRNQIMAIMDLKKGAVTYSEVPASAPARTEDFPDFR